MNIKQETPKLFVFSLFLSNRHEVDRQVRTWKTDVSTTHQVAVALVLYMLLEQFTPSKLLLPVSRLKFASIVYDKIHFCESKITLPLASRDY